MFLFVFIISLFQTATSTCLIYDNGIYEEFNILKDINFQCLSGALFIGSVQFQGLFCEPPQIIIAMLSYKYDRNAQFRFKILTQTTTEFSFQIECFAAQVHKYEFRWIAVNDNRIYVINDYMGSTELVKDFESQVFSFPIKNVQYFVQTQIISYFGGNAAVYHVKNADKFTIKVDYGISGLGVQIVAGLTTLYFQYGAFQVPYFENLNIQVLVLDNPYYLPILNQIYWFEINPNNDNQLYRELDYVFTSFTNGSQGISMIGQGWGYLPHLPYVYNFQTSLYQPHNYQKMRVSKKRCSDYKIYLAFEKQQLFINEINKTLIDTSSDLIDYNSKPLSFVYSYKCQPNKKIIIKILRCAKSEQYFYYVTQYCNKGINLMTMYINLYQYRPSFSKLKFDLTDYGFTLTQTMQEGSQGTYELIKILIQSQV